MLNPLFSIVVVIIGIIVIIDGAALRCADKRIKG